MYGSIGPHRWDMPGSWDPKNFPKLSPLFYIETSPASRKYNCIAHAAGDATKWWWPDALGIGYWPPAVPRAETLDAFIAAYEALGYEQCGDGSFEAGYLKVAIYATTESGQLVPTHAALQTDDGCWTSKLGNAEDIEHALLSALDGPQYGRAVRFLRRQK